VKATSLTENRHPLRGFFLTLQFSSTVWIFVTLRGRRASQCNKYNPAATRREKTNSRFPQDVCGLSKQGAPAETRRRLMFIDAGPSMPC
jgi:hypothetical protein